MKKLAANVRVAAVAGVAAEADVGGKGVKIAPTPPHRLVPLRPPPRRNEKTNGR